MRSTSFTVVVQRLAVLQHDARIVHALLPMALEHARSADRTGLMPPRVANPRARRTRSGSPAVSTDA
ncbi:hypothetical protein [Gemmatimonas sp.]|uniref:hypothetical protein n=1 Tax=Gemmatimonas sp. TaxID=1962908 RepID=UPI00286AD5A0|nr:hypothetical protein [Gemmatimonas sp.]